jgi:hypothetical protein
MKRRKQIAEFIRMPKTVEIPIGKIKFDRTGPKDDRFMDLYVRYLTGKLLDVRTRIDIKTIIPGFFLLNESDSYEQVGTEYEKDNFDLVVRDIRQGFRPSLFLYKGFVGPAKDQFICSDDLAAFYAYKQLGIRHVPAVVLGNHPENLQESGIRTRGIPNTQNSKFDSVVVHERIDHLSITGDLESLRKRDPIEVVKHLSRSVEQTRAAISSFHLPSANSPIHYHHTLFSVLSSLHQILRATELLIANDLAYQIRPLVRSAYDLFLNFYIDWMYPERMGALFQVLAVLSRIEKSSREYKSLAGAIRKTFGGLVDILMNQAEKGRISPLGSKIHRVIYSDLSPAVHQDFGVIQEFGEALESGSIDPIPSEELHRTLQFLDIVVTAAIVRIADDVGLHFNDNY